MQEILFRGFYTLEGGPDTAIVDGTPKGGKWVYGFYAFIGGAGHEKPYIIPAYASAFYGKEVEPSTVGQYTGLVDKNGKKIFVGDAMEFDAYSTHYQGVVTVIDGNCSILCREDAAPFLDLAVRKHKAIVIGTIYDAPPEET